MAANRSRIKATSRLSSPASYRSRSSASRSSGVYAAGDITEYPGKVRLISVGFGEAAIAVNNAAVAGDPTAALFPGHSTTTAVGR